MEFGMTYTALQNYEGRKDCDLPTNPSVLHCESTKANKLCDANIQRDS